MEKEEKEPDSGRQTCASELQGSLPRNVQLSSTDGWYGVIAGLLLLGVGLVACGVLCFIAFRQTQQRKMLRRDGCDIVGKISTMHGGHGDSTVSYIFTFNGSLYDGKAQMPNYHLIEHKSDRIVIRFLPSNPAINHPAAWEWSGFADIFPGIFLLFLTTMGGVALGVVYRDRKLARNGKATQGVVIGCVQAKRYFRVEYEFCTEDGLRLKGKSDCADEYGAGARIWILYLPQKPKRNHVYPTSFYEVVG